MFKTLPSSFGNINEHTLKNANHQVGKILKETLRVQDMAVRISNDLFAVIFVKQTSREIKSVSQRLTNVIENTAFTTTIENESALTMDIHLHVADHMPHETGTIMLDQALHALTGYGLTHHMTPKKP